jgi:SCY1-like protein 1
VLKRKVAAPGKRNMDFLKSAVASAISKGPSFGYSTDERVDIDNSIWTLHNGTKRV